MKINLEKKLNIYGNNRSTNSESGQSLVELAFGIVMLLVLLAGIVDLGRAFFSYMALRDAAQEGALYGSLNPTDSAGIEARVRATSQNPINLQDTTNVFVSSTPIGGNCGGNGNGIQVTVSYNFPISMPFIGTIVGSQSFSLSATVTDTIILPPCS